MRLITFTDLLDASFDAQINNASAQYKLQRILRTDVFNSQVHFTVKRAMEVEQGFKDKETL